MYAVNLQVDGLDSAGLEMDVIVIEKGSPMLRDEYR